MTNQILDGPGSTFVPLLHGPSKFVYSRNAVCDENVLASKHRSTSNNQMKLIEDVGTLRGLLGTRTSVIYGTSSRDTALKRTGSHE